MSRPSKTAPPENTPRRRAYKVAEAALELGCDGEHVVDLIEEGKLRAINIGTGTRKHYRVPVEALAFYKEHQVTVSAADNQTALQSQSFRANRA